ncbi:protein kinase [Fusobacterium polymorphum]|uniref:Protein kinase n=1 Tax=Fusobacterium nucleatum subsp. polymorphum TaxID=76857 RepID=A0A2B7Y5P2_FUSNP|nr:protein kinase [Fusobacterium polymorphum]PGH19474.1 protein kinase [Fusobacterium polymorphum]
MEKRFEKKIKSYILKNKDISVLTFDYEKIINKTDLGNFPSYRFKHIKILREDLLPIGYPDTVDSNILKKWIDLRKIPKNRENVNAILNYRLKEMDTTPNNFMNYIDLSYGLSFNDSYWIVPEEEKYLLWKDYNLYKNKFSDNLALVAFGEGGNIPDSLKDKRTSPEYTTDGMLAKCWTVINDEIYLLKKSSEHHKVETYAEYYLSQVAEIMNFEYVPYDLMKFHEHIVSTCKIFTTEDKGYSPIHLCLKKEDRYKTEGNLLEAIAKVMGKEKLGDIMVFDSIIYNIDRHLGNFGMITDNNTGKLLKPAPIFDNGTSIFNLLLKNSIQDIYKNYLSKFEIDFDLLSSIFVDKRHQEGLEELKNFKFKRHSKYNLPEELLEKAETFIQSRSRLILNQLEKKLIK